MSQRPFATDVAHRTAVSKSSREATPLGVAALKVATHRGQREVSLVKNVVGGVLQILLPICIYVLEGRPRRAMTV